MSPNPLLNPLLGLSFFLYTSLSLSLSSSLSSSTHNSMCVEWNSCTARSGSLSSITSHKALDEVPPSAPSRYSGLASGAARLRCRRRRRRCGRQLLCSVALGLVFFCWSRELCASVALWLSARAVPLLASHGPLSLDIASASISGNNSAYVEVHLNMLKWPEE